METPEVGPGDLLLLSFNTIHATQTTDHRRLAVTLRTCDPETPIDWHRVAGSPTPAMMSAVVEAAVAGDPQRVTKRGRPAVVVLCVDEYERLRRLERASAPALADLLLAVPQDDEEFERLRPRFHSVSLGAVSIDVGSVRASATGSRSMPSRYSRRSPPNNSMQRAIG